MVSSTSLTTPGSSAEVGSSNKMILGLIQSTRATATRCCWPPEESSVQVRAQGLPLIGTRDRHDFSEALISTHTAVEIHACLLPPSLHGAFRQLLHGGDFRKRETAEKFQIDHHREFCLDFRQFILNVADR